MKFGELLIVGWDKNSQNLNIPIWYIAIIHNIATFYNSRLRIIHQCAWYVIHIACPIQNEFMCIFLNKNSYPISGI